MPNVVGQTTTTPVVQTVTVTLTADEVYILVYALENYGYNSTADTYRDMLIPKAVKVTPQAYLATGAEDENIRASRKVLATKNTRTATGALLRESLDAVKARARDIGVYMA